MRSGLREVVTSLQKLWGLEWAYTLSAGNGLSSETAIVLFAADLPGQGKEKISWLGMRKEVAVILVQGTSFSHCSSRCFLRF